MIVIRRRVNCIGISLVCYFIISFQEPRSVSGHIGSTAIGKALLLYRNYIAARALSPVESCLGRLKQLVLSKMSAYPIVERLPSKIELF